MPATSAVNDRRSIMAYSFVTGFSSEPRNEVHGSSVTKQREAAETMNDGCAAAQQAGLSALPERQHVQPEPAPHDPEQEHGLEHQRDRGRRGGARAAEPRHQRDTEHHVK